MDEFLLRLDEQEREWLFAFMEQNEMDIYEALKSFLTYCLLVNQLSTKERI